MREYRTHLVAEVRKAVERRGKVYDGRSRGYDKIHRLAYRG